MNFLFIAEPAIFHARAAGHPRNANVSFELYRDYLIVLQVRVGPLKGLNFLLDTGATPSVLDPRIAAKLHLETVPTEIAVLQGTARGATATIPSLQVGPVVKENLPVLVEDLSFVQKVVPVRLDGIVGLDVLGQSAFVIDYVSHNIRFGSANLASSVPLQLRQGLAMLTATVNQEPAQLLLDTGAPSLILFRRPGHG
ncbi:MAG TPA: retropepsin-like aspartic protease, partial [Bryobacteraceae bacterium]